jgi:hypothetical protein
VLYKVSIEQRRAADSVKILQRVNSRNIDDFEGVVENLEERLGQIEKNVTHTIAA